MLRGIEIKNYAIIDHLKIDFEEGLTIITGETGAGKSIILGALGLILGNRADIQNLRDDSQKCVVEAVFSIEQYDLSRFFEEHDLDYYDELIIRREIAATGKSRAFINDSPTTLVVLKELSSSLVSLHQQFDLLDIQKPAYQLDIIDAIAQNNKILSDYQKSFSNWKGLTQKLKELSNKNDVAAKEKDFLQFQFDEIEKADITNINYNELESTFNALDNIEALKNGSQEISYHLSDKDPSILDELRAHSRTLSSLIEMDASLNEIEPTLGEAITSLEELRNFLTRYHDNLDGNESQKLTIEEQLNAINLLIQKHRVNDFDALLETRTEIETKLLTITNLDAEILKLEKELVIIEEKLQKQEEALTKSRTKVFASLEKNVQTNLADIAMPNARLKVGHTIADTRNKMGKDKVDFLFAANKGSELKLLSQVASGGEISRLTLCLKTIVADHLALPTMIFDEIDTGVSGDVSLRMGRMLKLLSGGRQVLCITHSAQIAAQADNHYYIYKEINKNTTTTSMRGLDSDDRILEIAKILSGDPPSTAAVENAKQLLNYN